MAAMKDIKLEDIEGVWTCENPDYTLCINKKHSKIWLNEKFTGKGIIDEDIHMDYDKDENVMRLSKSIILWMLGDQYTFSINGDKISMTKAE